MKEKMLDTKGQTDIKTHIVRDFNILLSQLDRSTTPKNTNKEMLQLNHTNEQMDLTGIYNRVFHPTITEYIFY